jgi:hypothetical protein
VLSKLSDIYKRPFTSIPVRYVGFALLGLHADVSFASQAG